MAGNMKRRRGVMLLFGTAGLSVAVLGGALPAAEAAPAVGLGTIVAATLVLSTGAHGQRDVSTRRRQRRGRYGGLIVRIRPNRYMLAVLTTFGLAVAGLLTSATPASSAPGAARQETGCSIKVGKSGTSQVYTSSVSSVPEMDFIRETEGLCKFTIFNGPNFDRSRRWVELGTALSGRIRAGMDGIENKDSGGGDTWRIRSILIDEIADPACVLRIGGNGIRMSYVHGRRYNVTPKMNRVSGTGCPQAIVFNFTDLQGRSRLFRGPVVFDTPVDVGFFVRSLENFA